MRQWRRGRKRDWTRGCENSSRIFWSIPVPNEGFELYERRKKVKSAGKKCLRKSLLSLGWKGDKDVVRFFYPMLKRNSACLDRARSLNPAWYMSQSMSCSFQRWEERSGHLPLATPHTGQQKDSPGTKRRQKIRFLAKTCCMDCTVCCGYVDNAPELGGGTSWFESVLILHN